MVRERNAFTCTLLDETYDAMYRAEDRLSRMFFRFTGIVVFIACLGLFGLAAFAALDPAESLRRE